jgi:hypothetical protein
MSPKRISYLMIVLVIALSIAVIAVAISGDILFNKQSEKLRNLKAQNQAIKEQEVSLAKAKADIKKYNDLDQIVKAIVPQDKDQAKTIREINAIAAESGVSLQQINFETSNLGLAAPKPSTNTDEGGSEQAAAPKPLNISQVKPVEGISGVYALAITVSSGDSSPVSYYRFLQFLEKLESNRRTAHVSNIVVTPAENKDNVTFSLTLNAYLKPDN